MNRLRGIIGNITETTKKWIAGLRRTVDPTHRRIVVLEQRVNEGAEREATLERRLKRLEEGRGRNFENEELLDEAALKLLSSLLTATDSFLRSRREAKPEDES